MNFTLKALLSFSIIIPAFIGLLRFSKINPVNRPFIYCIWIGLFNEILSVVLIKSGYSNAVNGNIYMLVESLIFTWQFKNWRLFERSRFLLITILVLICVTWLMSNLIIYPITVFSSYFLVIYSFIISLLSITLLNRLLTTERRNLLKNPVFTICSAFIIYYTFSVLSEVFWIYGVNESKNFMSNVANISVVTNFIANFLYAYAILWMTNKQRFTLPLL